jgi:mRNA-degrading endonuclease RelE of RelBE toxin-antitoxin system
VVCGTEFGIFELEPPKLDVPIGIPNQEFSEQSRGKLVSLAPPRDNASMARKTPFAIAYDEEIKRHLRAIETKYHSLIRSRIEKQLRFEPESETRNRKPLRQPAPFDATWELRLGPGNRFRVLYGVDHAQRQVQIQAIGVKLGNRLLISGEEIET